MLDAGIAVWIADGNRFFNRSGPGVVESAVMIAQAIGGGRHYTVPGELNLYNAHGFLSLTDALALIDVALESIRPSSPSPSSLSSSTSFADALEGAKAVVEALRQGDVESAWKRSSVSICMSLDTYKSVIVASTDFAPLGNPEHKLAWGNRPEAIEATLVKVSLQLLPAQQQNQDVVSYDFRMEFCEGVWMVKGVNRLA